MMSTHPNPNRKILPVVLAVILGVGVFANSGFALFACTAACCMGSGASANSHQPPKISVTPPVCCCTDTAAFPCEVSGSQEKQPSSPALLRLHQHDHRDVTAGRTDTAGAAANNPRTTGASTGLLSASILKIPIYLTTLTLLC